MNLFKTLRADVLSAIQALAAKGDLPDGLDLSRVQVDPPREQAHGDLAVNAAMVLAKPAGKPPRELAELLAEQLRAMPAVNTVEIAGPGFLNLTLDPATWQALIPEVLRLGDDYGSSDAGAGAPVNVEYVSANPTGPLHAAHARGAVVGDALAALLEKTGHKVTREYYINDAGAQVEALARSTYLRYREASGEVIGEIPSGLYPGDYLKDVGRALAERDADRWLHAPESDWLEPVRAFAVEFLTREIKEDLACLGITMDVWSSERALVEAGRVTEMVAQLEDAGLIYTGVLEPPKGKKPEDWEPRPQLLFRATQFGDDVDRPLQKSDGSWTYFANDIAYHFDKYQRTKGSLIDVLGADHSGYVKRTQAAVKAVTGGKGDLDVKICQMVKLLDRGQPVKMSKRAGTFVTLRDVVDAVGKDVVRFIMLTRKNDATLEFDYQKVTEQSRDNPVFYVQYAHARAHSAIKMGNEAFDDMDLSDAALSQAPVECLTDRDELDLIKLIAAWPRLLEAAAEAHEPHRIAFYLYDLASSFHGLWTKGKEHPELRFVRTDNPDLSRARLAMVRAMAVTVSSGLNLLGIEPVEVM